VAAAALLLAPVTLAIGQQRAVRHAGLNCYLSSGFNGTALVDLFSGPGTQHDWGIGNIKTSGDGTAVAYCPVTLDVPRADVNPIDRIRIIYSTRESPVVGVIPANVSPTIQSCTAFLMDGTDAGTWVASTSASPAGPNTGGLYNDGEIIIDGATVPLGSATTLRRMLITCTLPRGVVVSGSATSTYTALIKGYEVQYTVSSP
jgi:hypothetical protein